jgi:POT family proton-dependent oligopeptide transporter
MGINTGALVAPLITGVLGEKVGWHLGFGAAGVGMLIGLITYRLRADKTLGDIGTRPASADPREHARVKMSALIGVAVIALLVVLTMSGVVHINPVSLAEKMSLIMLALALLYFIYLFIGGGLTTDEKKRVAVIILLFFFATIFWAAFEQAPTSLNLFARDYTNRVVFGWEMPTLWLQAANSVFVIALAPVFAVVWVALGRRGKDPSSVAKFAWGLFFAGLGFVVMWEAANIIINGGGNVRVSPWWLVLSYFFQSVGELSLSPVGLSSMTKLAPTKFKGQMMGVWFMASALGNLIAGLVGGKVDPEKLDQMPLLFRQTSFSLFIAAVVCGLLVLPVRRMMRGVPAGQR